MFACVVGSARVRTLFCVVLVCFGLPQVNWSQPPSGVNEPVEPVVRPGPVPPPPPTPVTSAQTKTAQTKTAQAPMVVPLASGAPGFDPNLTPSPEKLSEQATQLLRDLLPREYENRKKWGLTERVVSGVEFERDGLRLKTHRRWKEVNHGLWKRYKAVLVDPDEQLHLQVVRIEQAAPGRVRMDIVLQTALDLEARIAKFQRNVRLLSVTALADATIELRLGVELGMSLDPSKFPPDVVFDVEVKEAELDLKRFKLRRLSDIKGGAAERLGRLVDSVVEDELKDQRSRLVEKLNKKIDKKRDKLRFSFKDLVSGSNEVVDKENSDAEAGAKTKTAAKKSQRR